VGVLATLHGSAKAVGCIHDLVGETLHHGVLTTLTGEGHQPTQSQGGGTCRANLDRNLVGCATDTAGADLEVWADVAQSLLEGADRLETGLLTADFESAIDDALCGGLLAVEEDLVHELADELGIVNWVLDYWTLRSC